MIYYFMNMKNKTTASDFVYFKAPTHADCAENITVIFQELC